MEPLYTVEQHIALKRVTSVAPSPDGTWLAVAVQRLDREATKYVSDLWKVPTDGSAPLQLTRGDSKDASPCFRRDGALAFLSNRQPNEIKPDEDADKRMQVWLLPAGGGEPQQLTDEPLGVEAFRFARDADRLVLLAPVLSGVEHAKQREVEAERRKKGSSARKYTAQPVRHWDHWLHEGEERPNTHVIACRGRRHRPPRPDAAGAPRTVDRARVRPVARRQAGRGHVADDRQGPRTRHRDPADRRRERRVAPARRRREHEQRVAAVRARRRTLAVVRSTRSPQRVVRPTLSLIDTATGAIRHGRDRLRRLAAHRRLERRRQAPLRHGRPRRSRAGLRRRRRRGCGRTHHREAQRRRALGPARAGRRPHRRHANDVPRAARSLRRAAEGGLAAADPRAPVRVRRSATGPRSSITR